MARFHYESTRVSTPQVTTIAPRLATFPPRDQLQDIHRDDTLLTDLATSEPRMTIAEIARARSSRLDASLSTEGDHASQQAQKLWAHDCSSPTRATFADHVATHGPLQAVTIQHVEPASKESNYARSAYVEKARLVTRLEELD